MSVIVKSNSKLNISALKIYQEFALRTKEDVMTMIQKVKEQRQESDNKKSLPCTEKLKYEQNKTLIDRFYQEIEKRKLIDPLPDWWGYGITIKQSSIALTLNYLFLEPEKHLSSGEPKDSAIKFVVRQEFVLYTTIPKMLTVNEFAASYNVMEVTVRQWIRRGHLKGAIKVGTDWAIPENAVILGKKDRTCEYIWSEILTDLPAGFEKLNDYTGAKIFKNGSSWAIQLKNREDNSPNSYSASIIALTIKEKEMLERYFIANPKVTWQDELCQVILQKK